MFFPEEVAGILITFEYEGWQGNCFHSYLSKLCKLPLSMVNRVSSRGVLVNILVGMLCAKAKLGIKKIDIFFERGVTKINILRKKWVNKTKIGSKKIGQQIWVNKFGSTNLGKKMGQKDKKWVTT